MHDLPNSASKEPAAAEALRIAAVARYGILDTPAEASFDRITVLASRMLQMPIALITFIDDSRIWFKSRHGVDVTEIPRSRGLCEEALLEQQVHVVTDARADELASVNALVRGPFGLQFYLGVPLVTSDGHAIGTLCVIDRQPRQVRSEQIGWLEILGQMVMDQMELRHAARMARTDTNKA
jgi:GAF domain-containing protein